MPDRIIYVWNFPVPTTSQTSWSTKSNYAFAWKIRFGWAWLLVLFYFVRRTYECVQMKTNAKINWFIDSKTSAWEMIYLGTFIIKTHVIANSHLFKTHCKLINICSIHFLFNFQIAIIKMLIGSIHYFNGWRMSLFRFPFHFPSLILDGVRNVCPCHLHIFHTFSVI